MYCILTFSFNFFFSELSGFGDYYNFFYTLIEYTIFSFILWVNIENKRFKSFILLLSLLFIVFQTIYLFAEKRKLLDSVPIGVETILILVYIFYFFYEQLKIQSITPVYKKHIFWIALGILIYLSGTFFFYILINYLPLKEIQPYWFITYIFDIVKNILLAVSVLVFINNPKPVTKTFQNIPNLDFN